MGDVADTSRPRRPQWGTARTGAMLVCDTLENVDLHALEVNSDLIAFAQLTFAYSTESVNGVPGERVPGPPLNLPAPAGPEGTFAEADGGGGPGPIES